MITREEMIETLQPDEARLQYDPRDVDRIEDAVRIVTDATLGVINSLGALAVEIRSPVNEDSVARTKALREDAVYAWGKLQVATSSLARTLRIDADVAYERTVQGLIDGQRADLAGL